MSPITKSPIVGAVLLFGIVLIAGCGSSSSNSQIIFDADTQQHPAGWLPAEHKLAAQSDESACTECHGQDLSGGISQISCSSCHLGGANSVHPTVWGTAIDMNHGPYVQTNGNTACANAACHGSTLGGVDQSGPSCTSCHLGDPNSIHPISWGTGSQVVPNHAPYVTANGAAGCSIASCHGTNLQGGVGPACASCHVNGSPLVLTGCTSCHGNPPSGTVAPNRGGAHAAHNALPNVTSVCNTCHSGAGTGTVNHDTGTVAVTFLSAYNAKSGAATYDAASNTCSKVSCHGGQTTPAWLTGTIDVGTQCTMCHSSGTSEYNSFSSGWHVFHGSIPGIICIACHDVTKLAQNHFTSLNTTAMEGPASATIGVLVSSYTGTLGTCTTNCHVQREWFNLNPQP